MGRLNNLVFVQYNAKLKNKKARINLKKNIDPLLAADANQAQGWLIEGGDVDLDNEPATGLTWKEIEDMCEPSEVMLLRRSARLRDRELHEDNFQSESEEEEANDDEDIVFESDHEEVLPANNYEEEEEE